MYLKRYLNAEGKDKKRVVMILLKHLQTYRQRFCRAGLYNVNTRLAQYRLPIFLNLSYPCPVADPAPAGGRWGGGVKAAIFTYVQGQYVCGPHFRRLSRGQREKEGLCQIVTDLNAVPPQTLSHSNPFTAAITWTRQMHLVLIATGLLPRRRRRRHQPRL